MEKITSGRVCLVVAGLALCAAAWTVAGSWLFVLFGGLRAYYPMPLTQWWTYALAGGAPRWTKILLAGSGLLAAVPIGLVIALVVRMIRPEKKLTPPPGGGLREQQRGVTNNHGSSDWLPIEDAIKRYPSSPGPYGGVVIGEAYRPDQDPEAGPRFNPRDQATWGRGGSAPLLIDPCTDGPTHSLLFAGSGSFKTMSAITTVLTWTGSSVILDPSCEIGPSVQRALEAQGKRVVLLSPGRRGAPTAAGFNAIDWIDTSSPLAGMDVHTVVSWIFGESPGKQTADQEFFRGWGKDLVACLLAHMLWDDSPNAPRTLVGLRQGVATPESQMRDVLRSIYLNSKSNMARDLAGSLMDIVPETFSGIYANAVRSTSWLSVPSFAALVSGDSFHTRDLAAGGLSVFVGIPLAAMDTTPALARVIIGALLNSAYQADGDVEGRILFLLDEAARLGRMAILETARDAGRKYGITLQLLFQSPGQLKDQWGGEAGQRSWYEGVSWRGYAAVLDNETAKEVSAACGDHAVLAFSEGDNTGTQKQFGFGFGTRSKGSNVSIHEIRRALIRPDELTQATRSDELFVITRGSPPLRCGRAIWFRRPELAGLVDHNRFVKEAA